MFSDQVYVTTQQLCKCKQRFSSPIICYLLLILTSVYGILTLQSPTVSEDQVRTVLKTLHPSVTLDSKANMEQTLTEFYHQTSQQCQNKADQQYKQALLQAVSITYIHTLPTPTSVIGDWC